MVLTVPGEEGRFGEEEFVLVHLECLGDGGMDFVFDGNVSAEVVFGDQASTRGTHRLEPIKSESRFSSSARLPTYIAV